MRALTAIDEILDAFHATFAPPPELTLSQWAEKFAYLSPENSASPGKWKSIKYQIEPMDAITDPATQTISFMKASRVGWTKIIDHAIGYYIHQDPCPIMVIQPTIDDAEDYSKAEIEPMIRNTPVLFDIMGDPDDRSRDNTILKKKFPGGRLIAGGANSPRVFRRVTVRVFIGDEIDGYPIGVGKEGDQVKLGIKRTLTFWNNKILLGSTPTIKDQSKIETWFNRSDKRFYFVPCPFCKKKQRLKWAQLRWPSGKPEKALYYCEHCGRGIAETHKQWMIENGEWIATAPFKGHAGFHISGLYSLFPNAAWAKLAQEFLDSEDNPEELKVFVNTVLGETWEDKGERVEGDTLSERREVYGPDIPEGIAVLTAGVDVHPDRLEIEIVGWGREYESWNIDYHIIWGDPKVKETWADLDDYLLTPWLFPDGRKRRIQAVGMDTGYESEIVYKYCKSRYARRVYAVKGKSKPGENMPLISKPSRNNAYKIRLWTVGTDTAKDMIYARLARKDHGPGFCHFPVDRDLDYFKGLTAETAFTRYKRGKAYKEWRLPKPRERKDYQGKRNEPLDCRVYALAALAILNPSIDRILEQLSGTPENQPPKRRKKTRHIISPGIS